MIFFACFNEDSGTLQKNQTCNIPFTYNNDVKYFCTNIDSKYQCEVGESGSELLDECNRGIESQS